MNLDSIVTMLVVNAPDLVGFLLPPVIEFLNREIHSSKGRFVVTVFTAVIAAVYLRYGDVSYASPEDFLRTLSLIFAESQLVYAMYFKDSGLRKAMQIKFGTKSGADVPVEAK